MALPARMPTHLALSLSSVPNPERLEAMTALLAKRLAMRLRMATEFREPRVPMRMCMFTADLPKAVAVRRLLTNIHKPENRCWSIWTS